MGSWTANRDSKITDFFRKFHVNGASCLDARTKSLTDILSGKENIMECGDIFNFCLNYFRYKGSVAVICGDINSRRGIDTELFTCI